MNIFERKKHNYELMAKVRNGESATSYDQNQSWWPKRNLIEKSTKDIKKLYGKDAKILGDDDHGS